MHDPMTQAFQIPYPWRKYGKKGRDEFEQNYREPFITVWHVDPETDGSDGSRANGIYTTTVAADTAARLQ